MDRPRRRKPSRAGAITVHANQSGTGLGAPSFAQQRLEDGRIATDRPSPTHASHGWGTPSAGRQSTGGWSTGIEPLAAGVVVLVLLLGSLTPFTLSPDAGRRIAQGLIWRLGWPGSDLADIATNLVIYLPVGATMCMWLRRRLPAAAAVAGAVVTGMLISYSVELLQTVIATRYPSWIDVFVNTAGSLVGALAAAAFGRTIAGWSRSLRARLKHHPASTLAGLMTVGLLGYYLVPFGFVTTSDGLHRSLRRARVLLPTRHMEHQWPLAMISGGELSGMTVQGLQAAGAFALLGCLTALGRRERGAARRSAIVGAVGCGWLLASVIETLQLFSTTHVFDMSDLLLNGVGATVGACLASGVMGKPVSERADARGLVVPGGLLLLFWIGQVGLVLVSAASGMRLSASELSVGRLFSVPFAACFRLSFLSALGEMAEVVAVFGMLTVTTAAVARRFAPRVRLRWVAGAVVLVATGAEVLSAMRPGGRVDTGDLILASLTVIVTLRLFSAATRDDRAVTV